MVPDRYHRLAKHFHGLMSWVMYQHVAHRLSGGTIEEIQMGILTAMVRMGKDILDRKIVDDVRMIDVGMIWGIGFPPDKSGPMKWADLVGLSQKLYGKNFY
jgi:hypothetical protein